MTTRWWNRVWAAALVAGLLLPAAASTSAATREGEAFQWKRALAAGKTIEIKGVNGDITASRATGKDVEVEATKRAKKSDPDEVTIEVIEHEGGVTICAKYPTSDDRENECAPGDGGHMNVRDNDVQVNFEVRVPAGVRLVARTVNGEIEADGMGGPVEARTVNGGVSISTTGYADATTVNGSITASMGSAKWPDGLSFTTVNGTIRLTLPPGINADVDAQTVNGSIDTDFPVTVQGKFSKRRLRGTIGKGGQRLDLETVNGGITLRSS